MRIALIGYGKMGKAIERIAKAKGHEVPVIIDQDNIEDLKTLTTEKADVVIEFTRPDSAFENITTCIKNGIPIVSGTTGWLDRRAEVEQLCEEHKGAFFYASNFSVGVNIFFNINKQLAKIMNKIEGYDVEMDETHHIHKLDAPSGTAITLAEGIIENLDRKNTWKLKNEATAKEHLNITDYRIDEVPGTHAIYYKSAIDTIEIKHTAHSREGFATGAVLAGLWLVGKQGIFGMDDMLNL